MNKYLIHLLKNRTSSTQVDNLKHQDTVVKNLNKKADTVSKVSKVSKCQHYDRGCKTVSACCNKVYPCRQCHDEVEDHEMDRHKVKKIVCKRCDTFQNVSQHCKKCKHSFGTYFCNICNVFDNSSRGQYHCDKCGICRTNEAGTESFHCDQCNICLNIKDKNNHKCTDISGANCPVCMECLTTSTRSFIYTMKCNHLIHEDCLSSMFQNGDYKCPLCAVSLIDMTEYNKIIDDEISNSDMPTEYLNSKVTIMCNDCREKSTVKFHIIGHKCLSCKSYNTRRI